MNIEVIYTYTLKLHKLYIVHLYNMYTLGIWYIYHKFITNNICFH